MCKIFGLVTGSLRKFGERMQEGRKSLFFRGSSVGGNTTHIVGGCQVPLDYRLDLNMSTFISVIY